MITQIYNCTIIGPFCVSEDVISAAGSLEAHCRTHAIQSTTLDIANVELTIRYVSPRQINGDLGFWPTGPKIPQIIIL